MNLHYNYNIKILISNFTEDYLDVLELQQRLRKKVADNDFGYILILQHKPVYTVGIHQDTNYPVNAVNIKRGGGVTFHGPGQIVTYYILNLRKLKFNILDVISLAHEIEISYLLKNKLIGESKLGKQTGIWIKSKKIASTGFSIEEDCTMHGTALNVCTDMTYFSKINPCGFDPSIMTSEEIELGTKLNIEKEIEIYKDILIKKIGEIFSIWSINELWSEIAP
ncbi:lipoyl(octanoyl) transferase LipB [Caldiplasma sukawensis]